jgi:hypothetical protein
LIRNKAEIELKAAKSKYLKCLKKYNYEEGIVQQLEAIRKALEMAHDIDREAKLQEGSSFSFHFPLISRFRFRSQIADHFQIMALQQQKQAIAESKRVEEQNIKIRAQIASVSAGDISPPPSILFSALLCSTTFCLRLCSFCSSSEFSIHLRHFTVTFFTFTAYKSRP